VNSALKVVYSIWGNGGIPGANKGAIVTKKAVFLFVFLACLGSILWAAGRKDNESRSAADPAGFTDSFDINNKPNGKWNYLLEAKDKAGNVGLGGPENMFLDPESDLPRVTVVNPMPKMHVQGNLNIVGVATDDDAVGFVEFTINRGRDGRGEELLHARARGADFWSYQLDTTDPEIWTDGEYMITAWATDINELSGISEYFKPKQHKTHRVFWNLDRKKPDVQVTSHETGALVAGKVKLRGTAFDGNMISEFAYSTDDRVRYTKLPVKLDKKTGICEWEVEIDTKKFEDGPVVIWLRAKDGMGTAGNAAHLFFVNNTNPEVSIAYPPPEDPVFGVFTVAGYAGHPVGLKSVTWKWGKQAGEFDLIVGNPWWSLPIDLRGLKESAVELEIRAEDVLGKVTIAKQRWKVDPNAGEARVTLQAPLNNAAVDKDKNLVVRGAAKSGEGISAILYSLDGGQTVEIPCIGNFLFAITNISGGAHTLDVWAKNGAGIEGPKVQVKGITAPADAPQISMGTLTVPSLKPSAIPFYSGMIIRPEPKMTVEVLIRSGTPLTQTSATIAGFPPVPLKPSASKDGYRAVLPIPANVPAGLLKIELYTVDRLGRPGYFNAYAFVETPEEGFGSAPAFALAAQGPDGRAIVSSPDEFLIGMNQVPLSSADIRGTGAENISVQVDQQTGTVKMRAMREGAIGPLTLVMTDRNGQTSTSPAFRVEAMFGGPAIAFRDVPANKLVQNSIPVRYGVTSPAGIRSVEYSVDAGSSWLPIPAGSDVSRTLDISSAADGTINVLFKAVNEADQTTFASFSVLKKTVPSGAKLVVPVSGANVNGKILLGFAVESASTLKSVTYNGAGQRPITREVFNVDKWDKDYAPKFLDVLMDPTEMPLDANMRFTFEDMAGNREVMNAWEFVIDNEMDIPKVAVTMPFENEVITTDFIVTGVAYDDDAVSKISWSLDGGPPQIIEAKYGFSIPIALSRLTDNEHYVTVIAEDVYGVKTPPERQNFRVSLAEPTAVVTAPLMDVILKEEIEIRGTAADRNAIKEVKISLDNGNTFNLAAGAESWNYRFNSKVLKDGAHVVFIKVWDKYDVTATYSTMINVDNTPPEVVMDSPIDGSTTATTIVAMGRALDPNLESVTSELRSLSGMGIAAELRQRRLGAAGAFKDTMDLSRQPDGLYNLEIVAKDKAGNITRVSRNVELARQSLRNVVEILYPLNNEEVQGNFNVYGYAGGTNPPGSATLRINGVDRVTNEVDAAGYFRFPLGPEDLAEGRNAIIVTSNFSGAGTVLSQTTNVVYKATGPWITIDTISYGDFAFERPYLSGRTGYVLSEEDLAILDSKDATKDEKEEVKEKSPKLTEISFDNGKTFEKTSKAGGKMDYRYRLETTLMKEGLHYILVRTTMKNDEVAVTRMLVQVDKTPPVIRLIAPETGGRYNQELAYSATATDDVELISLDYHLRKGDKSMYGIPGFLQGLYVEATIPPLLKQFLNNLPNLFAGGATYMDVGLGLSFFDDNVKIQANYGFMTQANYESLGGEGDLRYGGHVLGLKLLANVYALPFGPIAGPDWEWLSASLALGANFSLFDVAKQGYTQSGKPTWMSALLAQLEFPKVTIAKWKYFRRFSLFTEGQLWFVPTDVDAEKAGIKTVIPHVIMGVRIYVF